MLGQAAPVSYGVQRYPYYPKQNFAHEKIAPNPGSTYRLKPLRNVHLGQWEDQQFSNKISSAEGFNFKEFVAGLGNSLGNSLQSTGSMSDVFRVLAETLKRGFGAEDSKHINTYLRCIADMLDELPQKDGNQENLGIQGAFKCAGKALGK